MKEICIVGVSGSIGKQTLAVARRLKDQIKVRSIVAHSSEKEFLAAVNEFKPQYAAMVSENVGRRIKGKIPKGVAFAYGETACLDALLFCDTVVVAAGGFAGVKYTMEAIRLQKNIALANKETLVCGGDFIMQKVREAGVELAPIDSEHSAIWQALDFDYQKPFRRLILTASGGPFYHYTKEQLERVTPKEALKHPTWQMGAKISIDSATLLNKGFEVIEAHHLYGAPLSKIHTVVQPESIIHSMVEFEDGGILAQMSYPTMELPIQLALTYPNRLGCDLAPLDFEKLQSLHFLPLERKNFPCYHLALCSLEEGDNYPCSLNGAGEVAVKAFLDKKIAFTEIAEVMEDVLSKTKRKKVDGYDVLFHTDARARELALAAVEKRCK